MPLNRRLPALAAFAIAVAVAALGVRAVEAGSDLTMLFRVAGGATVLAVFVLGRRHSLAKRMAVALGLEIALGSVLFVYVDLPFAVKVGTAVGDRGADALWRVVHSDSVRRLSS